VEALTPNVEPLQFNPYIPEVHADPYPLYRRLREEDPVHETFQGVWVLSRYADCQAVLRDGRFSSDSRNSVLFEAFRQSMELEPSPLEESAMRTMLFLDAPDHTRLRALVSKAFTARVVDGMRTKAQAVVDSLLDRALARGGMDVVADLAYPLPLTVICEMLGVPVADHALFRHWSADLVLTLDPILSPEVLARANRATSGFAEYFRGLVARRRADPGEDLLTALIAAEDEGRSLTEDELLSMCILLLVAGHETTVNLISNGMLALLRNRSQLDRLRAEPALIRTAVEELLRYDSPVQLTGRIPLEDVEIGGKGIGKGQEVVALIGAANRDPAQFLEAERLDLGRSENRHIAFGAGVHFCLGAPLARLEGQIAIGSLVQRVPKIELAVDELEWRETVTLRGLKRLPVAFD
jgi:pimeloyl-[acyl-carrier protein] synthase